MICIGYTNSTNFGKSPFIKPRDRPVQKSDSVCHKFEDGILSLSKKFKYMYSVHLIKVAMEVQIIRIIYSMKLYTVPVAD